MIGSSRAILPALGGRWRAVLCLAALCVALPAAVARAQTPLPKTVQTPKEVQPPRVVVQRPSVEERKAYEKRMMATHPAKTGCFEAHFPDEHWVETNCGPAPKTPNPRAHGPHPNTVGDGTDWFAT